MTIRKKAMREHVMNLCTAHDIELSWCRRPTEAWAAIDLDEICIAPIRSDKSYSTALHEIGHIKGRHQRSRDSLVRERWAWVWAHANALIWTPRMERNRRESLVYATQNRHAVPVVTTWRTAA
jgi:hypothetical protein